MRSHSECRFTPDERGFSRVDVAAVVAILGLLSVLAAPSLAGTRTGSKAIECISGKRRLIEAWTEFATDNDGVLAGSLHGGAAMESPPSPEQPWAKGWLTWDNAPDNTNVLRLVDPKQGSLAVYMNKDATPFRCPSDVYQSSVQARLYGWPARVRSVSLNLCVGPGNAELGPWDSSFYRHIKKTSEFVKPAPANTWAFIDEHPDSINDPGFFPPSQSFPSQWVDVPASFHDRAAGVAMADGSAMIHYWQTAGTATPVTTVQLIGPRSVPNDPDIAWLRLQSPQR